MRSLRQCVSWFNAIVNGDVYTSHCIGFSFFLQYQVQVTDLGRLVYETIDSILQLGHVATVVNKRIGEALKAAAVPGFEKYMGELAVPSTAITPTSSVADMRLHYDLVRNCVRGALDLGYAGFDQMKALLAKVLEDHAEAVQTAEDNLQK